MSSKHMTGRLNKSIFRAIPPPLCGHSEPLLYNDSYKAQCPVCRSFWDMDALDAGFVYDETYPALRSHFDLKVGVNKVRTLKTWLEKLGLNISQMTICEVGFGGGHCLKYLSDYSGKAFGIEAIDANIAHASTLGISADDLYLTQTLPAHLPKKVDLWLFSDSFEHLSDPGSFMAWVLRNSSSQSILLIVAPEADSLTDKLLGRLWPHRTQDHLFHWSADGLIQYLTVHGFDHVAVFRPAKFVSLVTIILHLQNKIRLPNRLLKWFSASVLSKISFYFNIGEMGMLFRKHDEHN